MTEQLTSGGFDVRPGFRVGDADHPDQYRLEEEAGGGGESAVWRATSTAPGGGESRWAVRVLHAENLAAAHEESAADALERWYRRVRHALRETGRPWREVAGVVTASRVFLGPRPHPPGAAGQVRTLYVVSPWVDGDDLPRWLRRGPTFAQVCAVAARLAAIVDEITAGPPGRPDIAPANVFVDQGTGEVSLLDRTFAVPTRGGLGTAVGKDYTAPEALTGRAGAAANRYSFGGVVFFLLTGRDPAPVDAAADSHDQLVRASFPGEVAVHVAALLSADPDERPASLVRWAAELAELGTRSPAEPRYADLDVTVDGSYATTVTALGSTVLARARLAAGALWAMVPDAGAPGAPVLVRSVTDGTGNTLEFVVDRGERVMLGRAGGWQDAGRASVSGGLAVVRTATGSATAYLVDPASDRMSTVDVSVDGTVHRGGAGPYLGRVLAATVDHEGTAVVAATLSNGELVMITGDDVDRVGATGVRAATLGLSTAGAPVCYAAAANARELLIFEQRYGQWLPTGTVSTPGGVVDVACVGQRDGITLAVAGADGLWVGYCSSQDTWQHLSEQHCHRVALEVGSGWRVQLAAVVDGQVVVATEDFTGQWTTTAV